MIYLTFNEEEKKELNRLLDQIIPFNEEQFLLLGEDIKFEEFLEGSAAGTVKRAVKKANYMKNKVDNKVSNAIDSTYDAAREGDKKKEIASIRKDIMNGRGAPSTLIKRAVKIAIASVAISGATTGSISLAPAIALIGFIINTARRQKLHDKEKEKIIFELKQELKIVEEKINDCSGDENKKRKYQYIRIKMELERQIRSLETKGNIKAGYASPHVTSGN